MDPKYAYDSSIRPLRSKSKLIVFYFTFQCLVNALILFENAFQILKGEKDQIKLIVQYWDEIIKHYDCPWKGINISVY